MTDWRTYGAGGLGVRPPAHVKGMFSGFREAVVLDVETTGFSRATDRIVSVAVMRADFGALVEGVSRSAFVGAAALDSLELLVDPCRAIPVGAARVHGILDADVRGKPTFAGVAGELEAFIGDRVVIGHNVSFDQGFLQAEFRRAGRAHGLQANRVLCTMRRFQDDNCGVSRGSALDAVAARLGVRGRRGSFHEALEDTRIALEIAAIYYLRDNGVDLGCWMRSTEDCP